MLPTLTAYLVNARYLPRIRRRPKTFKNALKAET
jgi:hypothetical protein